MTKSGGISGVAVGMATAGTFLLYAGVKKIPLMEGVRSMLRGEVPTGKPPVKAEIPKQLGFVGTDEANADLITSSGTALGDKIVAAARKYLGEPYFWGGHVPTSAGGPGFDCSGFVTYVLVHDLGYTNLPNQVHTTTVPFLTWKGARDIPVSDCQAGDLVCWLGHIGIAVSPKEMIHAPTFFQSVKIAPWAVGFAQPMAIRRVLPKG